ncbi:MAG: AmmeMemoRadiSam system protein A [Treponema sp.]|jgi:AmmeMemoRadiSam system protein A|nr:AmmeMemoRadiSam system protein A [Treponema sp.]
MRTALAFRSCLFYTKAMNFTVNAMERQCLLAEVRETIAAKLEGRRPRYERDDELVKQIASEDSALTRPCGAFVTLHAGTGRERKLRGCIGRMSAAVPLEKTVHVMALEAAFGDPRFPPLKAEELPRCSIEISVLSPMSLCSDPRQLTVGVHGLYLIRSGRSGVLLPQVPVEQGWNLDEYLDYICIKAGLPPHSYEAPDAELYTFTATVFGEA